MSHAKRKRKHVEMDQCLSIPYIPILPSFFFRSETESDSCKCPTPKESDDYNMQHKKRGRAIIFNHYICHGHSCPRRGTECDVMRLGKTLSSVLEFEVRIYNDLKYAEIMDVLQKLSQKNFDQEDCLAIFVLTHGSLHGLTAADKQYAVEELWRNFTPTNCPTLAGKPKLFFINACRGKKFDEGVEYEGNDNTQETESPTDAETLPDSNSFRAPIFADFLAFYSTMEGFTSLRHPIQGTWFIQSFCDILENKKYRKLELKEILTLTTRRTALKCNQITERVSQVPTIMSTLLRNVYFNSKEQ